MEMRRLFTGIVILALSILSVYLYHQKYWDISNVQSVLNVFTGKLIKETSNGSASMWNITPTVNADSIIQDKASSCPHQIPSFEYAVTQQFHHILKLQPNFTHHRMREDEILALYKRSRYDVRTTGSRSLDDMDYVQLTIRETRLGGSGGGAGMMVRVKHVYLLVCPVTDHFNGSYTVHCPMYHQRCANISVLIKHINFSSFNGPTTIIEKYLWKGEFCQEQNALSYRHNNPDTLHSRDMALKNLLSGFPVPKLDTGHWFQYENQWRWVGEKGQVLPLSDNTTMCGCFKRFHRTYFLGASHQHINHDCLAKLCPASYMVDIDANTVKQLVIKLPRIFKEMEHDNSRNLSHRFQVIVQIGSWDLNKHDFHDIIYHWLPKFESLIRELQANHSELFRQQRIRLLVMSSPSLPDADRIGKTIGLTNVNRNVGRNNWISAVLTYTLRKHVSSLQDVDFLDEFGFTFPLYWFIYSYPRYPNHHYCMWSKTQKLCYGHIGKAYTALIASKLCPNIDMY